MEPLVIECDVATALQDLQLGIVNDGRTSAMPSNQDTLLVHRSRTAGWARLCRILLFPIGLLALLAPKQVRQAVVGCSDNGDGTTSVRISGDFSKQTREAILEVVEFHSGQDPAQDEQ